MAPASAAVSGEAPAPVPTPPRPAVPAPVEFRGLRFGEDIRHHPDFVLVSRLGDEERYRNPREKAELGGMPLADLVYIFEKGRFQGARMVLTDYGAFQTLKKAYVAKYGPPWVTRGGALDAYVWNWPELRIELTQDRRDGRVEAVYTRFADMPKKDKALFQDEAEIKAFGPIGFRGARFGERLSAIPGMIPVFQNGDVRYCRRENENLDLGGIRLKDVLYFFYKDRFYYVSMLVSRYDDFEPLRAAYLKKYGKPRENLTALNENYVWTWEDAQISLDRNATDGAVEIAYAFVPLLEEAARGGAAGDGEHMAFMRESRALYATSAAPAGFRGIAWGGKLADAPGLEYVFAHKGVKNYRRPDEKLSLGSVEVEEILYSFYKDRFFYAAMSIRPGPGGDAAFTALREAYAAKYGPPRMRATKDADNLIWAWPAMHIALIRYKDTGRVEVCYAYDPVLEEIEKRKIGQAMDALYAPFGQEQPPAVPNFSEEAE